MRRPHSFILFFELYVVMACLTLISETHRRLPDCERTTAACIHSIGTGVKWSAAWPVSSAWALYNYADLEGDMVSNSVGTPIGNLTGYGGLAASFDNNVNKVATSCSAPADVAEAPAPRGYNNFIGKDWGSGVTKRVAGFRLFGATNQAIMQGAPINLKLQGSNDNEVWTDLFVGEGIGPGGPPNLSVTTGIDISTPYRFHRISIQGNRVNALVLCRVVFAEPHWRRIWEEFCKFVDRLASRIKTVE